MKTVISTQLAQVATNGITSTKDLSLNPTGSRIIFVYLKSILNFTHSSKANLMASQFKFVITVKPIAKRVSPVWIPVPEQTRSGSGKKHIFDLLQLLEFIPGWVEWSANQSSSKDSLVRKIFFRIRLFWTPWKKLIFVWLRSSWSLTDSMALLHSN